MKKNRLLALLLALVLMLTSAMPIFANEGTAETIAVEAMQSVENGEKLEVEVETEVEEELQLNSFLGSVERKQPSVEDIDAAIKAYQAENPNSSVVEDSEVGVMEEPTEEELLRAMAESRASYGLVYASMDMYYEGFVRGTTMYIPLTLFSLGYSYYYYVYVVDEDYDIVAEYSNTFSRTSGISYKTITWDISSSRATGEYYIVTYTGGEILQEIPIYITSESIPATELVSEYDGEELVLEKGQTEQVSVLPGPLGATTARNIVWSSSDTSVAVVQELETMSLKTSKVIKAVGYGTCTITITMGNLKTTFDVYVPDPECPFKDVSSGKWYYNAVKWAYSNGYITGTSDTTFSPNDPMTRGMLVTVLYRAEGRPSASATTQFADVDSSKYYTKAISWASKENLVSGYSNGNFGPEDSITREQIAKILYRYAEYKGYDVTASSSLTSFDDDEAVSSYAVKYMKWAVAEGFIQGSNNKLNPKGNATRAEIAAILKRFVEKY